MESAPGTRDPLTYPDGHPTADDLYTELVVDALLDGYGAYRMVRNAQAGSNPELATKVEEIRARLTELFSASRILELRPSAGLATAYGFRPEDASDLTFFMVRTDTMDL